MKKKIYSATYFVCWFILLFLVVYLIRIDNENSDISVMIVPHHDLAAAERDRAYSEVSDKIKPDIIVILSPNHFNTGVSEIITTDKTWKLQNGNIYADQEIISMLTKDNLALNDDLAFSKEHGIYNQLEPVNKYFPNSLIVPIIIKDDTKTEKLDKIVSILNKACTRNCLVIASVDFSHYLPGAFSEIHDNFTIRALSNLDYNAILSAEVDSKESLYIAIRLSKLQGTQKFNLLANTNSGKMNNERDAESTSYVFGWFSAGKMTRSSSDKTFLVYNNLDNKNNNIGERFFYGTDILNSSGDFSEIVSRSSKLISEKNSNQINYLDELVKNGNLAISGVIGKNNIKLVLMPWKINNGLAQLLTKDEKTARIGEIREALNVNISNYNYGYDTIYLTK